MGVEKKCVGKIYFWPVRLRCRCIILSGEETAGDGCRESMQNSLVGAGYDLHSRDIWDGIFAFCSGIDLEFAHAQVHLPVGCTFLAIADRRFLGRRLFCGGGSSALGALQRLRLGGALGGLSLSLCHCR